MTEWYYILDGQEQGPISEEDLKHIFHSSVLGMETAVRQKGNQTWVEAVNVKELNPQEPIDHETIQFVTGAEAVDQSSINDSGIPTDITPESSIGRNHRPRRFRPKVFLKVGCAFVALFIVVLAVLLAKYARMESIPWIAHIFLEGYALKSYPESDGILCCVIARYHFDQKNFRVAVEWLERSAERDNPQGQTVLAKCYAEGQGVPKDLEQAVAWYRKAAEQGHATAQNNLGLALYEGEGTDKDFIEAYKWLNLAASSGNTLHRENFKTISERLDSETIAVGQRRSRIFKPRAQKLSPAHSSATNSTESLH